MMKRFRVVGLLLLAVMLSFVMVACGEDAEVVTDLALSKSSLTMEKGSAQELGVDIYPTTLADSAVLTWTVVDASPAGCVTVNAGLVTAVEVGTATVRVSAGDISAECSITVLPPVESVTLNKTTLALVLDQEEELMATVLPANAITTKVTWTLKNVEPAGCVTVANGVVKAIEVGTATVVATVGSKTSECVVTVTMPTVTAINVSPGSISLPVGDDFSLGYSVLPERADPDVTWSVVGANPAGCVEVDAEGTVTAKAQGTATIRATSVSKDTVFGTCGITVVAAGTRALIPVSTPADFMATRFAFDADYYLTQDIDFADSGVKIHKPLAVVPESDYGTEGSGTWYLPSEGTPYKTATLNGTFDGRGFALKNFTLTGIDSEGYYFGTNQWGRIADFEESIFGNIGTTGVIKNIGFIGGSISTIGQNGIIAARNYGRIENIYIKDVSITVTHSFGDANCAGGLLAYQNMASGIVRNIVVENAISAAGVGSNSSYPLSLVNNVSAANSKNQVSNLFVAIDNLGVKTQWVASGNPNGGTNLTPETNNAHLIASADVASVDFSALPDMFWDKTGTWPVLKELGAPILVLGGASGDGYTIAASIGDEGLDYNFTLTVAKTHDGTPSIQYSVLEGVTNQTLAPNANPVLNADGSTTYTFTIPANNVTGTITLGAVTGLTARATYAVSSSVTLAAGFSFSPALANVAYDEVEYTFSLRVTSAAYVETKIPKFTYTVGGGAAKTIGHTSVSGSSTRTYVFTIPSAEVKGAIVLTAFAYVDAQVFTVTNSMGDFPTGVSWATAAPAETLTEGNNLVLVIHITADYEAGKSPTIDVAIGAATAVAIEPVSVNVGGSDSRREYTFRIQAASITGNITLSNFQMVEAE